MTPRLNGYLLVAPPVLLLSGVPLYWADAPVGWWHVLVVYLLATFPLSILLAERLAAEVNPRWLAVLGVVLGVGLALGTALAGRHLTSWLWIKQLDLFTWQSILGTWCLLLQLPWCLAGRWAVTRFTKWEPAVVPRWRILLLALVVAAALPAVWIARVIETESKKAEALLAVGRSYRASKIAGKLWTLGSRRLLAGEEPGTLYFRCTFRLISGSGGRPWPPHTSDEDLMQWATFEASQGCFDVAAEMLVHVSGRDPAAALLLASIYKEQDKWKECEQYNRLALALLERLPRTEKELPGWVQAYHNLAEVASQQKRYGDARKLYEEALRRLTPVPAQAHFHFQLGRLHRDAGRPFKAMEHLREAVRLDAEGYEAKAGALMNEMRLHTPGCLLRWY